MIIKPVRQHLENDHIEPGPPIDQLSTVVVVHPLERCGKVRKSPGGCAEVVVDEDEGDGGPDGDWEKSGPGEGSDD